MKDNYFVGDRILNLQEVFFGFNIIERVDFRIYGLLSFYVVFLKRGVFKSERILIQLKCVKIDKLDYGIYILYVYFMYLNIYYRKNIFKLKEILEFKLKEVL